MVPVSFIISSSSESIVKGPVTNDFDIFSDKWDASVVKHRPNKEGKCVLLMHVLTTLCSDGLMTDDNIY